MVCVGLGVCGVHGDVLAVVGFGVGDSRVWLRVLGLEEAG